MGIKGIYGEIGPGERVALSKLAVNKLEQSQRPLRIAIDVSIWQFQTQAGQGGSNPAIRTFYYRLQRLLSVSVQPLFVFDGPHKPPFKRGKKTGHGAMVPNLLTKQLLKLFGFPIHMAPGEAEAECALLQREGIVDAVLSEDVDTLMFGCGLTLRNWSSEGTRGNKSPTHVSVYDAKATKEGRSGLDREGMILVALMSGGDYIPEGIPGCGIKVACEAARAGYGESLCRISRSDVAGLKAWRESFARELETNESKFFRTKHKTLRIPEEFPNREALGYYTHPVVSSATKVRDLKEGIAWNGEVDVPGLRLFVTDAFEWTNKIGARKFIRGLAPALLVHKLRLRADRRESGYGDVLLTQMNELDLVRTICGQRVHLSTDGIPELRVVYHPMDIIGIDLDEEQDDDGDYGRDGLAPVQDDDQIEAYASDEPSRSASPTKRAASVYDPTQPDKLWIPQTLAKLGVPLKVEDYEESLRNPKKGIKKKPVVKKAIAKGGMPKGALDRFVKVSKPLEETNLGESSKSIAKQPSSKPLPPVFLAPALERAASPTPRVMKSMRSSRSSTRISNNSIAPKPAGKGRPRKAPTISAAPNANPWTLAQTSSPLTATQLPQITKELMVNSKPDSSPPPRRTQTTTIDILSSSPIPEIFPPSPTTPRKHQHSPTPPSSHDNESSSEENEVTPEEDLILPSTVTRTRGSRAVSKTLFPLSSSEAGDLIDRPSPRKKHSSRSPSVLTGRHSRRQVSRSPSLAHSAAISSPLPDEGGNSDHGSSPQLPSSSNTLLAPIFTPTPALKPTIARPNHQTISISISSSPPTSPYLSPIPQQQHETSTQPSPSSPPHLPSSSQTQTQTQPLPPEQQETQIQKQKKKKKRLLLRESIGTWQEVGEDEIEDEIKMRGRVRGRSRRAVRESQVEVLDLRGE